jgi:hypothetical protein
MFLARHPFLVPGHKKRDPSVESLFISFSVNYCAEGLTDFHSLNLAFNMSC